MQDKKIINIINIIIYNTIYNLYLLLKNNFYLFIKKTIKIFIIYYIARKGIKVLIANCINKII